MLVKIGVIEMMKAGLRKNSEDSNGFLWRILVLMSFLAMGKCEKCRL